MAVVELDVRHDAMCHLCGGDRKHLHHVVRDQPMEANWVRVDLLERLWGTRHLSVVSQERQRPFDGVAQDREGLEWSAQHFAHAERKVATDDSHVASPDCERLLQQSDVEHRVDLVRVLIRPRGIDGGLPEESPHPQVQRGARRLLHVHEEVALRLVWHCDRPSIRRADAPAAPRRYRHDSRRRCMHSKTTMFVEAFVARPRREYDEDVDLVYFGAEFVADAILQPEDFRTSSPNRSA
jgi:hypothetical protein